MSVNLSAQNVSVRKWIISTIVWTLITFGIHHLFRSPITTTIFAFIIIYPLTNLIMAVINTDQNPEDLDPQQLVDAVQAGVPWQAFDHILNDWRDAPTDADFMATAADTQVRLKPE